MSDIIETDMNSVNFKHIIISKPKKTDDSLFGKISYNDKQLNLHFDNLQVIKHKKIKHLTKYYTVLFLKIPKSICKLMIEFDNHCIEQVKQNIAGWFTKALDENVIEEYYTSSVSLSEHDGFLMKLKLQGSDLEDMLDSTKLDLVVSLKGLRFYKQRFIPEWEIANLKRVDDDFLNSIKSDDEDIWQEDDIVEGEDDIPEPTEEELENIYETLYSKLDEKFHIINNKHIKYASLYEDINSLLEKLKSNKRDLTILENISIEIDELFGTSS
jgi:hypothetical protein